MTRRNKGKLTTILVLVGIAVFSAVNPQAQKFISEKWAWVRSKIGM